MVIAVPIAVTAEGAPHAEGKGPRSEPRLDSPHGLVRGLLEGNERAAVQFFDQYSALVERTIARILGRDAELADAVQEAFLSALNSLPKLRDPQALPQWVRRVAVATAVDWVRRRARKRWLTLVDPAELTGQREEVDTAPRDAMEATYAVLTRLPIPERTVFALRHIEGLSLGEIADACGFSLATTKRRLSDADRRFRRLARRDSTLQAYISDEQEAQA